MTSYSGHMTSSHTTEELVLTNIKRRIEQMGSDGKHIATRAGIIPRTYYRTFAGGRSFSLDELDRIAKALEVDVVDLFLETPGFLDRDGVAEAKAAA